MNFTHLHLHTLYSMLDGSIKLDELADKLNNMAENSDMIDENNVACAMTDHGNLHGAVQFHETMRKNDINPILGCEVYTAVDDNMHEENVGENERAYHLVLLAKNKTGWENLIKISSAGYTEGFYYNPRVDSELIRQHSEGLIVLSGCMGGRIQKLILRDEQEKAKHWAQKWQGIVGEDDFYLELQYHNQDEDDEVVPGLIELSDEINAPLVTTGDAHFLEEGQKELADHLAAIETGNTPENPGKDLLPDLWVKTPEEMIESFPEEFRDKAIEGMENTGKIAKKCDVELDLGTPELPSYPIIEDDKAETPKEKLWGLIDKGLEEYDNISYEVMERVNHEMSVIEEKGYIEYFLVVWDFIQWAKSGECYNSDSISYGIGLDKNGNQIELDGGGIRVGPGRGSAAGCMVSYLIGITEIDPIENNLLFERFLNPERDALPDIDIDFEKREREKVIDYCRRKYGKDYMAQLGTFGSMKGRGAIRDVGRVRGEDEDLIEKLTSCIPVDQQEKFSIEEGLGTGPDDCKSRDLREKYEFNSDVQEFLDICLQVEGLYRHASTHAAGVLITPEPVLENIPVMQDRVTQFDMDDAEAAGAVKFDFLGLITMDIIKESIKNVSDLYGTDLSYQDIPNYDEEFYELFRTGRTNGIFQMEENYFQNFLRDLQPDKFQELADSIAINRPGPLKQGVDEEYIARARGEKDVDYPHKDFEYILNDTYGLMIYQEQVMKICQEMAGYDLAEADIMRRAIGKKKEKVMKKQEDMFKDRSVENGYDADLVDNVWNDIKGFADYGFNRAHASSYARVAVESAYIKYHYPTCFAAGAASILGEEGKHDRVSEILNDYRRNDGKVIWPNVNKCNEGFRVISEDELGFGLETIKHTKQKAVKEIIRKRKEGGEFDSIEDFCYRVDRIVDRKTIESIGAVGGFKCLDINRATATAEENLDEIKEAITSSDFDSPTLFNTEELPIDVNIEEHDEWGDFEIVETEEEMLGTPNLMRLFETDTYRQIEEITEFKIEDLELVELPKQVLIGGLVTNVKTIFDKNDNRMAFVEIMDPTGEQDIVLFSSTFSNYQSIIQEREFILTACQAKMREGEINLIGKILAKPNDLGKLEKSKRYYKKNRPSTVK